nr:hypothetical protein [Tanacetum cinerariifolium]
MVRLVDPWHKLKLMTQMLRGSNKDVALEFSRFQPFIDQVVVPVYSESGSVDREMILSDAIPAICQSAERRGLCP